MTLRDVQHLCWKNFRIINDKLDPKREKLWTPLVIAAELLEKSNKAATITEDIENSKKTETVKAKNALAKKLSQLLYSIFVLAEHHGINLEEAFLQTMDEYILNLIK